MHSNLILKYEGSGLLCDLIEVTYRSMSEKPETENDLVCISYQWQSNQNISLKSVPHGEGIALFCTGICYEGRFVNGKMHGRGRMEWPNGVVYEGEFFDNMIQGKGTYKWPNGNQYSGQVEAGKRHGKGTFTLKRDANEKQLERSDSGGEVKCQSCHYDGEWKDGLYDGWGTLIYDVEENIRYEGNFLRGKRHGHGIMRYSNSDWYEGDWVHDEKNGNGVMTWHIAKQTSRNTDVVLKSHTLITLEKYEGGWKKDRQDGIGRHIWLPSGSKDQSVLDCSLCMCNWYEGEMKEGVRHGVGTFHYENGSRYEGEWKDNVKDGLGIFVSEEGRITLARYQRDHNIESIHSSIGSIPSTSAIMLGGIMFYIDDLGETTDKWRKPWMNATLRYNAELSSLYRMYSIGLNGENSHNPRPMMTILECRALLQDAQFDCSGGRLERLLNQVRIAQRNQALPPSTHSMEVTGLIQTFVQVNRSCQAVKWQTETLSMKSLILYREFAEILIRGVYQDHTATSGYSVDTPAALSDAFTQFINQRLCPLLLCGKKEADSLRKRLRGEIVQIIFKKHANVLSNAFTFCCDEQRLSEKAKEKESMENELLYLVCETTISIKSILKLSIRLKMFKTTPLLLPHFIEIVRIVLFCENKEQNATESACEWRKDICLLDGLSRTEFEEIIALVANDAMGSGECSSDSQFAAVLDAFIASELTDFQLNSFK
uniref:Radial spoke head 10 family protein putative n=1 Tax=Albugo laibachii Nc14 TaxID=890382 RepID=F0WL40_9STRA|nr:radial spoke head 10 family protein putative [Albugo laibachii Nc14]|eukprot:CCA22000.1 radial spoke head 10 family protein putative [Albugo laibachii Nc14]